jgi:hypothetical protein
MVILMKRPKSFQEIMFGSNVSLPSGKGARTTQKYSILQMPRYQNYGNANALGIWQGEREDTSRRTGEVSSRDFRRLRRDTGQYSIYAKSEGVPYQLKEKGGIQKARNLHYIEIPANSMSSSVIGYIQNNIRGATIRQAGGLYVIEVADFGNESSSMKLAAIKSTLNSAGIPYRSTSRKARPTNYSL